MTYGQLASLSLLLMDGIQGKLEKRLSSCGLCVGSGRNVKTFAFVKSAVKHKNARTGIHTPT